MPTASYHDTATEFDRDTAVRLLQAPAQSNGARDGPPELPRRAVFEGQVAANWRTGRGPHGGYLAAIIMRALTETVADPERAARTFTVHFARSPEPGPVRIEVVLEREGRSLSTLSARMEQDGALIALVLSAFSVPWHWPDLDDSRMPEVSAPDRERRSPATLVPQAPEFMDHLVIQPRIGGAPFTDTAQPMETGGWLGLSEPRAVDPISLVFYADGWLPAVYLRLNDFVRVPTVDLTVHFRAPLRRSDPDELVLVRFHTDVIQDGFFEEDGTIWAQDGTVLAQSRQLGIVMR
jgi:acyl-CoA thioesterase